MTRVVYPISGRWYKMAWALNTQLFPFSNGNYKIRTLLNTNYCIDVCGASQGSGANVQVYHDNTESNAQNFTITHVKDGWYRIQNMGSGKVLDVANGSTSSGTNVWQCHWNGTDALLWQIINTGNGYYLRNKLGCFLDVANGTATDSNNVWVYAFNGSNAQKFTFTGAFSVTQPAPTQTPAPAPSTTTGYVKTSNQNNRLNVRSSPNTSSRRVARLAYGTKVTIVGETGSWYQISSPANGYVSKAYIVRDNPNPTPAPTPVSNTETEKITARLNEMMSGTYGNNTYKLWRKYTGPYSSEQCKGFAKQVHKTLLGYNIGSTKSKPYNYQIGINGTYTSTVGSLTNLSDTNLRNLFAKGRPGDFIQVRRSHTGSHSMIFLSADNNSVTVYESNLDGKNTIAKNTYSWSKVPLQQHWCFSAHSKQLLPALTSFENSPGRASFWGNSTYQIWGRVIDSRAFSDFCGGESSDQVPNGDILGRFRNLLLKNGLQEKLFHAGCRVFDKAWLDSKKGTIVDSTFIEAPSSTKNQKKGVIQSAD